MVKRQSWPFLRKRVYPSGRVAWIVDARTKTGGKKRVFETKGEAEGFAHECRLLRENEGVGATGNEDLAYFGKTVRDAIEFYLEYLRREARSVPVVQAVDELVDARRGSGKSERYCDDLRLRLGRFAQEHEGRTVAGFGVRDIDAWLTALPVAPGTRNTYRRDLRTLFTFCVRRNYCESNPAEFAEIARNVGGAPGILTPEEAERLLAGAAEGMLAYVAIGLFAGLRSAELLRLDWREVDLASGHIEVTAAKAKTARRRLVTIKPNLIAWLAPIAKTEGLVAPEAFRYRWDATKRAAGFYEPRQVEQEPGLKPWPPNAMRHSFGSYWLASTPDAAALALQMGNSAAMVFAHYRELVKPDAAARYWALMPKA